jgi:hypothetical protein
MYLIKDVSDEKLTSWWEIPSGTNIPPADVVTIFPEDDVYYTLFRQYMPYFASFCLQLENGSCALNLISTCLLLHPPGEY